MVMNLSFSDLEFEKMLEKYQISFQVGSLVKGCVSSYVSDGVLVDIGAKTDALVPLKEILYDAKLKNLQEILPLKQEFEFLVFQDADEDGQYILSHKKVAAAYVWKQLEQVKENDDIVVAVISDIVKGGILVDVSGVKGFVPSSHLRIKETDVKVGNEIELKILALNPAENNFILSNKKILHDNFEQNKQEIFERFEVGQKVEGEVVRITDFGAFININGIDGLLPLSQISWRWVEHPKDILKLDEKILVEIINIDKDKKRLSLSLKNLEVDPWLNASELLEENKTLKGVITRLKHFGAFVEILDGIEALLPLADINAYQNKAGVTLQVGEEVLVTITKFNLKDRRISLTIE